MVILFSYQEAVKRLTNAEVAFVGRLTNVTRNLSISSTPPVNHFTLKFENELRTLKGSISTIYEFHYQQKLIANPENIEIPKEGHLYICILHTDNNTIEILIEIEENDLGLFQPSTQ